MVASIQYPHIMNVSFAAQASIKNENGDWLKPNGTSELNNLRCRVEPNSKGSYTNGQDGKKIEFSSLIFIEGRIETIPIGSEIKVLEGEEVILETSSLKFSRDFFHSRLWV
ncbi:hypothetical protein [Pedobacter sp. Leaf132]|uniref:hypothetical protein n=1 Tax=Pedobacter sp. Leaf132 TaxID=2876557 RepID=UPI001E5C6C80|nr:hypothetical protein [Pedobacter sp. Leaf132]